MALSYPKRQEYLYALNSFSLLDGADPVHGLRSFKVTTTIEGRDHVYGTGVKSYGRPRGNLKVEVEIKFIAEAFFDYQRRHPQILTDIIDSLIGVFEDGSRRDKIECVSVDFTSCEIPPEGTEATEITLQGTAIDFLINDQSVAEGDSLGQAGEAGAA